MSKPVFSLETIASEDAVRDILDGLRQTLETSRIDPDLCGSIAIAVAEALNNVVEHAYAGQTPGTVRITAEQTHDEVRISIWDQGLGLPNGTLPPAHLPEATGPLDSLPEGGFGWYMIHDLTNSLSYRREAGENQLDLVFAIQP